MGTNRMAVALLLAAVLATAGCAAVLGAGAGAGAYKYVSGEFDTTYHHPYDQVYGATLTSLKDMNIAVTNVQKDAVGAKIDAKRADGTGVKVGLNKTGSETTTASIRVGTFGDEEASRVIANNIAGKLGEEERQGRAGGAEGRGGQGGQQGQGGM